MGREGIDGGGVQARVKISQPYETLLAMYSLKVIDVERGGALLFVG